MVEPKPDYVPPPPVVTEQRDRKTILFNKEPKPEFVPPPPVSTERKGA
jgi:hypothetical protein